MDLNLNKLIILKNIYSVKIGKNQRVEKLRQR